MRRKSNLFVSFLTLLLLAVTIPIQAQMSISLTPSNYNGFGVSFFGANDGSIDLTVIGGTPPYTYEWSNEATTQDISNLAAGYYEVVVTDATGETLDDRLTLEAPEELQVFVDKFVFGNGFNVSCYNCFNGSIWASAVGGLGPYTFVWDDGYNGASRFGVGAGEYQVTITDANGSEVQSEYIEMHQPERDDWTMGGNYGTNPAYQYIGTADNKDVVFKSNNTERFRLKANGEVLLPSVANGSEGILKIGGGGGIQVAPFPVGPMPLDLFPFWKTDGNYLQTTNGGIAWLGSKDAMPLRLRTNNIERMQISKSGRVGIGMTPSSAPIMDFRLFVADGIITPEVKVQVPPFPDYVFEGDYELLTMDALRDYLRKHKHLPHLPTADEVAQNEGVELGDMQVRLLRTIEEQALYILMLQEAQKELREHIKELQDVVGK